MDLSRRMDRRRFVRLLAAGAAVAAAAAAPLGVKAANARQAAIPAKSKARHRAVTAAMRKEIEVQKKSITDMLKVIRAYELPAGSPPAPIFHAIRAARRER
jgi:anaerobic selenocysteine-containing dehydrogenase